MMKEEKREEKREKKGEFQTVHRLDAKEEETLQDIRKSDEM